MARFVDNEHAVRELSMFAEHSRDLYRERVAIEKTIKQSLEAGTYTVRVGQILWRGWFDIAADLYVKEFPSAGKAWDIFPSRVREAAATEWEVYERAVVGEGSSAAGPLFGGAKPNPLARRDYSRHAALQRDLERYYKDCQATTHVPGGKKRRAGYCSGVAWKRARAAWRYPDYPGFREENPRAQTVLLTVAGIAAVVLAYRMVTLKP